MIIGRRKLITGLISLVAAPAIVRASSLMPVKALKPERGFELRFMMNDVFSSAPLTGARVSGYIARPGEPYRLLTAPLVELGEGTYEARLTADETADDTMLRFSAEKAQDTDFFIAQPWR